jgi:hypothetical protein
MTDPPAARRGARSPATRTSASAWPLAGIVLVLALQFTMVFTRAINWDEFWHYSLVVQFTRGTLTQPLQTFFVRLFQWLPLLPGNGVDHVIGARIAMFGCEAVTIAAIVKLAGRFADRTAGLLCGLAYVSAGFVLQHGFSFRFDPVDAALLMSALCVLACTRFERGWVLLFAALSALAAVYTIKCVLYAPAFAGVAWLRWSEARDKRRFLTNLALAGCASVLLYAVLLYLHSRTVPNAASSGGSLLQNSANEMFSLGSPLYRLYILKAAMTAPLLALLIAAVPVSLWRQSIPQAEKIAIAGLWLPISTLGFYHNTAPYFYAFILPPVAVACALPLSRLLSLIGPKLLTTVFTAMAALLWTGEDRTTIDRQRVLLNAAETIFPDRVAYFDSWAMLGRLDKANGFMSPWGNELYLQGKKPSMREAMRGQAVPLVFEDDVIFTNLLRTRAPSPNFLPADAAAVRETYLPFWGPFWVAGKIVPADATSAKADILVPGPYTLSGAAMDVDGRVLRPGDVINLGRGTHSFSAIEHKPARLTWGAHLRAPDEPPPRDAPWVQF